MERLFYLIEEEVRCKSWDPVSFSRNGPSLSHLFFADDIILTAKANDKTALTSSTLLILFAIPRVLKLMINEGNSTGSRMLVVSTNPNRVLYRKFLAETTDFRPTTPGHSPGVGHATGPSSTGPEA
ncbi:hypothetical protein BUALT_Bualt01G0037200 [Buddleja alternifolia]|uniref:Reverse transcriptase n=1 Tax=Buddleja alternifolia TaxID=168488 RepID=A0AAV6Y5B3_9LAMI|nr:hypothetical protein BUALT_Bualt01G0037200 [Buddleja alternifolia]